eukprot:2656468-Rhodomonas_salina.1
MPRCDLWGPSEHVFFLGARYEVEAESRACARAGSPGAVKTTAMVTQRAGAHAAGVVITVVCTSNRASGTKTRSRDLRTVRTRREVKCL